MSVIKIVNPKTNALFFNLFPPLLKTFQPSPHGMTQNVLKKQTTISF